MFVRSKTWYVGQKLAEFWGIVRDAWLLVLSVWGPLVSSSGFSLAFLDVTKIGPLLSSEGLFSALPTFFSRTLSTVFFVFISMGRLSIASSPAGTPAGPSFLVLLAVLAPTYFCMWLRLKVYMRSRDCVVSSEFAAMLEVRPNMEFALERERLILTDFRSFSCE